MTDAVSGAHHRTSLAPLFIGPQRRFDADVDAMFVLVDRVIAEREVRPAAQWPQDFLSLMLQPDPKTGERLDLENIRFQILTFLVAGHETIALAVIVREFDSERPSALEVAPTTSPKPAAILLRLKKRSRAAQTSTAKTTTAAGGCPFHAPTTA